MNTKPASEPSQKTLQASSPKDSRTRQTVSVIIPTLNREEIIGKCLDAVTWADEVIVVDMFSTDRTEEICRSYSNVRFLQRKDYIYANVNYGMEQAETDWVIRLDSDEIIDQELQASILQALAEPQSGNICYAFPSVQYMFGRPLRPGAGLAQVHVRRCMFRRGTASYVCKHEHEDIVFDGNVVTLTGHYHHLTNVTTAETINKYNYYTSKDAERLEESELRPARVWHTVYRAIRMFILYYFQWGGYKDGDCGFYCALYRGPIYIFFDHVKRWEQWRNHQPKP